MSAAEREAANEKDSEAKRASREYLTARPGIILHCHNASFTGKVFFGDMADAVSREAL